MLHATIKESDTVVVDSSSQTSPRLSKVFAISSGMGQTINIRLLSSNPLRWLKKDRQMGKRFACKVLTFGVLKKYFKF